MITIVQATRGETDRALAIVREAQQVAVQINAAEYIASYAAFEAELQLRQGNIATVEHWAESIDLSAPGPLNPTRVVEHFVSIRLLLAQHNYEAAQTVLTKLENWARELGRNGRLITIHVFQAHAAYECGQMVKAIDCLSRALQLAEPEGYIRVFLDGGQPIAELLGKLNALPEAGRVKAYIRQLLVAFGENIEAKNGKQRLKAEAPSLRSSALGLVEPLTGRELELLRLVAAGHTNQEIAQQLFLAVGTVKKHLNNIFSKLGAGNRTQAIARARELDLL